ncbi:MAG: hypothetical protein COU35_04020 [Candidatus Magasanikbacteria bacterium CG10_big_fil_rev_8_21_14_0_10_47_10]|uniref:DUF5667 domain-containing protein n=1 Tax=Candidatus Magasanikbacteria bacterium CG10_big_fil_rev_8_21_14_0_10_47_10 TaxID=1974652 RepID=A0A2H0TPV5_9BACT|nr:MAG: hypothetical protein COU35_04020 [Candidatus Magasanikbacteria bacterium CG10_big_fil_rev_8_21_14_0_10_47_10]
MDRGFLRKLKGIKNRHVIAPDPLWKSQTRERIISYAAQSVDQSASDAPRSGYAALFGIQLANMYAATRGVFMFVLVCGIVTGSLVATASPIPRDVLFNVKVAVASATGNNGARVQLYIDEAQYQSDILQGIIGDDSRILEGKEVAKQVQKIQKQVETASKGLETVKQEDEKKAADLAKDVSAKTVMISDQLKQVSKDVAEVVNPDGSQSQELVDAAKQVVETRKVVTESGIGALQILAQSDTNADENVKKIVQDAIGGILADAKEVNSHVVPVSEEKSPENTVSSTEQNVIGESQSALSTSTQKVSSSTPKLDGTSQTSLSGPTNNVKSLTEDIEQLLSGDQLPEAIAKVKILNSITSQTEAGLVGVKAPQPSAQQQPAGG